MLRCGKKCFNKPAKFVDVWYENQNDTNNFFCATDALNFNGKSVDFYIFLENNYFNIGKFIV